MPYLVEGTLNWFCGCSRRREGSIHSTSTIKHFATSVRAQNIVSSSRWACPAYTVRAAEMSRTAVCARDRRGPDPGMTVLDMV